MSLSLILDDIADKPPMSQVSSQNVTCLEHLEGVVALLERAKSVDSAIHTKRLLQALLKDNVVSKASALEAFTMLPFANDESMLLTQAATQHNHKLVAKAAANFFSNPQEAGPLVAEVLEMVEKTIESSKKLNELCGHYRTQIQSHLERLTSKAPIVISGKTSINLLTADVWLISNFDTYTLDYKPYEGVLDAKFRAITSHHVMTSLLKNHSSFVENSATLTLASIADYVYNHAKMMLEQQQSLMQTRVSLKSYAACNDEERLNDTGVAYVLETLSEIKKNENLFVGDDCFASIVLECLSTLV